MKMGKVYSRHSVLENGADITICDELTDEIIAIVKNDNSALASAIVRLINDNQKQVEADETK